MTTACCKPELKLGGKIMSAAVTLKKLEEGGFSLEDLVVQSWRMFPETFGLIGYVKSYPDSNKVSSVLAGEKGLVRRGLLIKMSTRRYFASKDGREWTRRACDEEESEPLDLPSSTGLGRVHERLVSDMLSSTASRKFREGLKAELSFADACGFWGLPELAKNPKLDEQLVAIMEVLAELLVLTGERDVQLSTGQLFSAGDARVLNHLDSYLRDRFSRHLKLRRGTGLGKEADTYSTKGGKRNGA